MIIICQFAKKCQKFIMGFLTFVQGFNQALAGANSLLSMFRSSSSSQITGGGPGHWFWEFCSCSVISTTPIGLEDFPRFMKDEVDHILKHQSFSIYSKKDEFFRKLKTHEEYKSYYKGQCLNAINSIGYNKDSGSLHMFIYTFTPNISIWGEKYVNVKTMNVELKYKMAKNWIIVSKINTNFFRCTATSEIKYLPQKEFSMSDVVQAIGIAIAPAVLGIIPVPPEFLTVMNAAIQHDYETKVKQGIIAPSPEVLAQQGQLFQQMVQRQDERNNQTVQAAIDSIKPDAKPKTNSLDLPSRAKRPQITLHVPLQMPTRYTPDVLYPWKHHDKRRSGRPHNRYNKIY